MAVRLPDIMSRVRIDTSGLDKAKQDTGEFGKKAKSSFGGVGKAAAAAAASIAAIKIGQFFKGAVQGAEESRKLMAQTRQVIESTGSAANVTAEEVAGLSEKMSRQAGIHDEIIQNGANLLLTFKNIKNVAGEGGAVFDRTVAAALDLSVAMDQDMKSSAIQLGKALNDPIQGVSALQRVGVSFTDQQKEQIATLVESGDVLEAQKMILAEVESQFGGSAAAQATGFGRIADAMDDFANVVGDAIIPAIDLFTRVATPFVQLLGKIPTPIVGIGLALGGLAGTAVIGVKAVGSVAEAFSGMKDVAVRAIDGLKGLDLSGVASNLGGLATTIKGAFVGAFTAIKAAAVQAFAFMAANPWIVAIAAVIAAVVLLIKHWDKVKAAFQTVVDFITAALGWLKEAFFGSINLIIGWFEGLINSWIGAINTLIRAYNRIPMLADIGEVGQVNFGRLGDQGGGGQTVVNNNITVNNPAATTAEDSIQRELRKNALLGIA